MERPEYKDFKVLVKNPSTINYVTTDDNNYIRDIQKDNLREGVIRFFIKMLENDRVTTRDEFRIFGSFLFLRLFTDEFKKRFHDEYCKFEKQKSSLFRLTLEFDTHARDLAEWPWEYIYYPGELDGKRGFFIATETELVLTRRIPEVRVDEDEEIDKKDINILVALSQPGTLGIVMPKPVLEAIEDLQQAYPERVKFESITDLTKKKLKKKIDEFKPQILHYIGHGQYTEKEGFLAGSEDEETEEVDWIVDDDLADCVKANPPNLVILQACEGAHTSDYVFYKGVALQLIQADVAAVIAMQYPIINDMANEFSQEFYNALKEKKGIEEAVQQGRNSLAWKNRRNYSSRDFGSPVVYMQCPEGIYFFTKDKDDTEEFEVHEVPTIMTGKVDCPYSGCHGEVRRDALICTACKQPLEQCPNPSCRRVIEKGGTCDRCEPTTFEMAKEKAAVTEDVYSRETLDSLVRIGENIKEPESKKHKIPMKPKDTSTKNTKESEDSVSN